MEEHETEHHHYTTKGLAPLAEQILCCIHSKCHAPGRGSCVLNAMWLNQPPRRAACYRRNCEKGFAGAYVCKIYVYSQ